MFECDSVKFLVAIKRTTLPHQNSEAAEQRSSALSLPLSRVRCRADGRTGSSRHPAPPGGQTQRRARPALLFNLARGVTHCLNPLLALSAALGFHKSRPGSPRRGREAFGTTEAAFGLAAGQRGRAAGLPAAGCPRPAARASGGSSSHAPECMGEVSKGRQGCLVLQHKSPPPAPSQPTRFADVSPSFRGLPGGSGARRCRAVRDPARSTARCGRCPCAAPLAGEGLGDSPTPCPSRGGRGPAPERLLYRLLSGRIAREGRDFKYIQDIFYTCLVTEYLKVHDFYHDFYMH